MVAIVWTSGETAIIVAVIGAAGIIGGAWVGRQLRVIHGLVNSTLSSSMQSDLDTSIHSAALMREVMALNRAQGIEPSDDAIAALALIDAKIVELAKSITDRNTEAMNFATRKR